MLGTIKSEPWEVGRLDTDVEANPTTRTERLDGDKLAHAPHGSVKKARIRETYQTTITIPNSLRSRRTQWRLNFRTPVRRALSTSVLHRPFGCVPIGCGEYVPTAEQEAQGLTAEFFEDLVPSFLRRTPPAVRRRLLEERGMEVPSDLIARTAHLAEFQQSASQGGGAEPMAATVALAAGSEREDGATEGAHAFSEQQSVTSEVTETTELLSGELRVQYAALTEERSIPLVEAIAVFLSKQSRWQWSGTCGEILDGLERNGRATTESKWPETPQQLGIALRRHREDLERRDIELSFQRKGKSSTRVVTLRRRR